jgi:hypothetical protein
VLTRPCRKRPAGTAQCAELGLLLLPLPPPRLPLQTLALLLPLLLVVVVVVRLLLTQQQACEQVPQHHSGVLRVLPPH